MLAVTGAGFVLTRLSIHLSICIPPTHLSIVCLISTQPPTHRSSSFCKHPPTQLPFTRDRSPSHPLIRLSTHPITYPRPLSTSALGTWVHRSCPSPVVALGTRASGVPFFLRSTVLGEAHQQQSSGSAPGGSTADGHPLCLEGLGKHLEGVADVLHPN